jgi:scyllo-inositol 2-dehydrogenase (NAD+)
MDDFIRVCVVGTGRAGMVHAKNFRWRVPLAHLVAIVDQDAGRADQAVKDLYLDTPPYTSLEDALNRSEFDAVVITTPTFTHAELTLLAAKAGKHILCEKPMALTLAETDQMIEAAQKAMVNLQIAFMRRFDPAFVAAKKQIDEGLIGQPIIVRSLTRGPGLPPTWARDPHTSIGMLAEVNSHDFDTIRWLAGSNYSRVYAQAGSFKAPEIKEQFPSFYDTAVVSLQMENGTFGMLDGVCPVGYGYDARAEVVGSEGILMIGENREMALTRVTRNTGIVQKNFISWPIRFENAYIEEATHFVTCIRDGKQSPVTGFDGRCSLEAILAATESIRTGQPINIPFEPMLDKKA